MALETKKEGNIITELASSVRLPKMVKVKQLLDHSHIDINEIPGIVRSELDREELRARIKPGASVAITCGSRSCQYSSNHPGHCGFCQGMRRKSLHIPGYGKSWRSHCPGAA